MQRGTKKELHFQFRNLNEGIVLGGAADQCHLHVGDEILAINEVRLSDALTQDDIVQLIVKSVITGSLSLVVRRYGKSKKSIVSFIFFYKC